MSLQLNNHVMDYKEFYGPNNQQMPLLIGEGRTPLSVAGLMRRYLEVLELQRNAPKELKPAYASLVKAWEGSYFDTGDGAVRSSSGAMNVVPDAPYLRLLIPETRLVNGAVDLSAGYTLVGEIFGKEHIDKYCGMPLSRSDAKKNPVWLTLARGDKALLDDFVDARFARAKERFNYDGKMMGVYAPPVPSEGAAGRLWTVGRLGGNLNSRAYGSLLLDDYYWGRLVGVAPEAQRAAAAQLRQPLEQRV